jgi:hypothetical protein
MSNRSRIVLGSLAGAFAIHVAALACSSSVSIVRPPDASVVARDGGVLDALASVVDAVGGAAHDVAAAVVDGEVRDARAGGDPPRTMEAPCNVRGSGLYADALFARFAVPGLDPSAAGEIHARVCNYVGPRASILEGVPIVATCYDLSVWSGPGSVAVYCGTESDHGTTARIWLH